MSRGPASFGELLRQHRLAAALAQDELAERAALSRRAISDLERGAHKAPYPATVRQLADALALDESQRAALLLAARGSTADQSSPLPVPLTSFIGRARELLELQQLLEECRLLTLTGAGGVGKTRLALRVLADLKQTHPGDTAVVELASLSERSLVAHAVGQAVGIHEQAGRDWLEVLEAVLRSRQLLLVLDNCEHLIAPCAELAERLLRTCPDLRVLATSREPLRVTGETTWRVPSLTVPDLHSSSGLAQVAESEAVQLFVERASANLPGFTLTAQDGPAVAHLCRELDGIPLAIELAAAWLRVLSVEQICDRLHDALSLLVSERRNAPARQQTLRATLDWSYELLDPAEKQLLDRLSVFAGSWTLEAAEAICGEGRGRGEVLVVLAHLVDKSLVTCERREVGPVRYRLLETVRQFGAEHLAARAETSDLRTRHMNWFVAVAERSATRLNTPQQAQYFEAIQQELADLRAAIDWAIECGNANAGLRLAAAMRRFWFHGHQTEGQAYLRTLLELPPSPADRGVRSAGLAGLGSLTRERGDLVTARSLGEHAVTLAREVGDLDRLFDALTFLGWTVAFQRDWSAAERIFQESLRVAENSTPWHSASAVAWLGNLRALQGDVDAARLQLEDAVDQLRELGDGDSLARCLTVLADLDLRDNLPGAASQHAHEALQICQSLGHAWAWAARALDIMVRVAYAQRDPERAITLAAAVSVIHPRLGSLLTRMARPEVVELARRELGPERAAALWAQGQAMTGDEAVVYALSTPEMRDTALDGVQEWQDLAPLTRREGEVAQLVSRGLTNRQIGEVLVITEGTAALHVKNALRKLGFRSRVELAAWVVRKAELSTR
jgi:non-specific serine/threonine protein kinase